MLLTLPATSVGQRVLADARNSSTARQEHVQEVDKFLDDLKALGKPTLETLENM